GRHGRRRPDHGRGHRAGHDGDALRDGCGEPVRRGPSERQDPRALVPDSHRRGVDRRWVRPPRAQGIRVLPDGLRPRRGAVEPALSHPSRPARVAMRRYVASRLAQALLVVLLSLTAVFGMVRLGGDPVLLFLPMDIQAKDVNAIRQQLGFNDPLLVQYGRFMRGAVHGDFGESLRYRRDALGLVLERLPATLLLAGTAVAPTRAVAVPLG